MRSSTCIILLALAATPSLIAQPEFTSESLPEWREYLLPDEPASCWRGIPWQPSFARAVVEAQKKDQPVLLWAMNGHPLGCT